MAAARPRLAVLPSGGAENAWSRTSSSASNFLDLTSSPASPVSAKGKAVSSAQPSGAGNVKKMRRRVALLSGVRLNLPSSPIVSPPPPGSSRGTAWTFTAEWDPTGDGFVFSDLESSSSSGPASSASARFFASPVPRDVGDDEVEFEAGSPPPTKTTVMSASISAHIQAMSSTSSVTAAIIRSPHSLAATDIFDLYTTTPSTQSFNLSDSKSDSSSSPSSPIDSLSSTDSSAPPSPPSHATNAPSISVTFFDDGSMQDEYAHAAHPRSTSPEPQVVVAPMTAFEPISWESLLPEKSRYAPMPKSAGIVFRRPRPLPPVPVRSVA